MDDNGKEYIHITAIGDDRDEILKQFLVIGEMHRNGLTTKIEDFELFNEEYFKTGVV